MAVSVEPEAVRQEANRWINLADDMGSVLASIETHLWLGPTAFFIGNLTEVVHYPAYVELFNNMVTRTGGAEIEFELIGIVLRKIADSYEETDQISGEQIDQLYTATDQDMASVTGVGRLETA
jgi:hypothetical protein